MESQDESSTQVEAGIIVPERFGQEAPLRVIFRMAADKLNLKAERLMAIQNRLAQFKVSVSGAGGSADFFAASAALQQDMKAIQPGARVLYILEASSTH